MPKPRQGKKRTNWIWMPHAGHFICAARCQFHLNTYVGGYIVSTVGEYKQNNNDNEFTTIGLDRLYETMVFKARKSKYICCPYEIIVEEEVDMQGYNDADTAYLGHLKLCRKWGNSNA